MKKQKLHIFPLETPFLRKIQTGVQYFNENHYTNFGESSIEITAFNESRQIEHLPIDQIFEKVLKTLSLHNMKCLTKLSISIQASFAFKISTVRKLGLSLASQFKTLKQLDLRFLSCKNLNGEEMGCLLDSLTKGMRHLTEINLYLLACTDLGDQCLEDIKLFILKRCKRLKILKVVISSDILEMSGEGYVYFEPDLDQRLRNHNPLCEYSGGNGRNQITSSGSASLCRGVVRYLKRLRSLTFKVDSLQEENDPTVPENSKLIQNIWRMISNLSNLQNLNFSASECHKINDEQLAKLTSCIGKNLQSLSLDFPYTDEVTERGYQRFAQDFFSSLPPQLTYFALSFGDSSEVTDVSIREIGSNIVKNLKSLETLILRFSTMDKLTGQALLELTQIISKGLPSLKKLILSFDWCDGIDQTFSIMLPEQIQQFDLYLYNPSFSVHKTWKGLKRLSLSFDLCSEKESFLDLFSEPGLALKNLSELKLFYSQSKKLGNKEVGNLASAIGTNMENLTSLELGFSDCLLLTGDSLLFLSDKLCRKLKNLRHLNFSFFCAGDCQNSSFIESGVRYLVSIITSRLESLESLKIFFCASMDEEMNIEEVADELCSAIARNLRGLKKMTFTFNLSWNIGLMRKIREKLCHIPMIYLG